MAVVFKKRGKRECPFVLAHTSKPSAFHSTCSQSPSRSCKIALLSMRRTCERYPGGDPPNRCSAHVYVSLFRDCLFWTCVTRIAINQPPRLRTVMHTHPSTTKKRKKATGARRVPLSSHLPR